MNVSACANLFIITVLYLIPSCGLLDCRGCSSRKGQRGFLKALSPQFFDATSYFGTVSSCKNTAFTPHCLTTKKKCIWSLPLYCCTLQWYKWCHPSGCLYFHVHIYVFVFQVNSMISVILCHPVACFLSVLHRTKDTSRDRNGTFFCTYFVKTLVLVNYPFILL